jgi:short-subunit dehydrogenase
LISQIEEGMAGEDVSFLVFNAAAEHYGEFLDLDLDLHLRNIAVNIIGQTKVTHHFGRKMLERGKGGIVLCSSLGASVGLHIWVSYSAAKAYDHILGEGLWYELQQKGVDACTLMIGATWSDNFQRMQKKLGSIFAESREPENLPDGFSVPILAEDVAANLFAQIDKEWLPTVFANPADKERWAAMSEMSTKPDMIRMGAEMQRKWYQLGG